MSELYEAWLNGVHGNTARAYEQAVRLFQGEMGVNLDDAGKLEVVNWVNAMRVRGLAAGTIRQRVSALRSYYAFCVAMDARRSNPADALRLAGGVSGDRQEREALTEAEAARLLEVIRQRAERGSASNRARGRQDLALIQGYLITGLRSQAWRRARWDDFEMDDKGRIWYRWESKGSSGKALIPEGLYRNLVGMKEPPFDRLRERDHGYLFVALGNSAGNLPSTSSGSVMTYITGEEVNRRLRRYCRLAGIGKKITCHCLRHTTAMLYRSMGADVGEVQEKLHHSSAAVTQHYLHRMEGQGDRYADVLARRLG